MATPCYSGANPIQTVEQRMAAWKWIKENGIDQGLPFEKIHELFNNHFFNGMGRPEWVSDILAGKKTPYRFVANDVWKKQYNRRMITQQALQQTHAKTYGPIETNLRWAAGRPRWLATAGHSLVLIVTHAGELVMRPLSWSTYFRGVRDTYAKTWKGGDTERLVTNMKRANLFDTGLRCGLDVGDKSHGADLISRPGDSHKWWNMAPRAWDVLKTVRFNLWNQQMEKHIHPGMSEEEILDYGKNLAEWANHATGSAKGPITNLGGNILFGPKITQSKLNRIFADPAKTIRTVANWKTATPGERAVAATRISGLTQYVCTMFGFLAANQGFLMATGKKDKINFEDPKKADWLAFKAGGMEFSIPGMHSEFRMLSKVFATAFMTDKELRGESKQAHVAQILGQYEMNKLNPVFGLGLETLMGQDYMRRPMPWTPDRPLPKTAPKKAPPPRLGWVEYALTHGPIPLQGPIGFFYDQMRSQGASAHDATTMIKNMILVGAVGATGIHISPDRSVQKTPKELKAEKIMARQQWIAAKRKEAESAIRNR